MSTKSYSILNLLTWKNAPVAFFAVFGAIWHGHPIRIMIYFFLRASTMIDLFFQHSLMYYLLQETNIFLKKSY